MGPRSDQTGILAERYLEIVWGDLGNTFLLLIQAPVIALCIVLVWGDTQTVTDSLWFVLALSAVWFGAINSCREIVKERDMYRRERRVGLDPTAYVLSKIMILAMLGFIQCLCLIYLVNLKLKLPGGELLHFVVLFMASLAGSSLGLALSAFVSTSDRAVAGVPLLLLPQVLFSEAVMSHEHSRWTVKLLEDLTMTSWAYDGLKNLAATEPSMGTFFQGCLALGVMSALLLGLTIFLMRR
ncbi:MAG: hypothetical protein AMXMBFR33_48550 [Candidatus Xenobia bacterium]|jgi:hypothetical protein